MSPNPAHDQTDIRPVFVSGKFAAFFKVVADEKLHCVNPCSHRGSERISMNGGNSSPTKNHLTPANDIFAGVKNYGFSQKTGTNHEQKYG